MRYRKVAVAHVSDTPPNWGLLNDAHGLGNALSEATNTHLRLLTRRAYGYHSAEALIAMATLTRGGLCPPLPGRS
jgi:transposase